MGNQRALEITNYHKHTYNTHLQAITKHLIEFSKKLDAPTTLQLKTPHDNPDMRVQAHPPKHNEQHTFYVLADNQLQDITQSPTPRAQEVVRYHANALLYNRQTNTKQYPRPHQARTLEEAILVGSILTDHADNIMRYAKTFAREIQQDFHKRLRLPEEARLYSSAQTTLLQPLTKNSEAIYVQTGNTMNRIDAYSTHFKMLQATHPKKTRKDLQALKQHIRV